MNRHTHLKLDAWNTRPWLRSTWRGWPCLQTPVDMQLMHEVIHQARPELIIETGTHGGGHALFLRDQQELAGVFAGQVISIGLPNDLPKPDCTKGLHFIEANSIDRMAIRIASDQAADRRSVMVILDSDHSERHVLAELKAWHSLVKPAGMFLVVCDGTAVPGPGAAVQAFLGTHDGFQVDHSLDRFGLSNHAGGWLRKT